ncbi:hypothetical protein ACL6C3_13655 [Capilliphycus salinus ALCB114379]|uniref:hypothetical protein n=1 Tax=Capilliphycus salinus TaxID=2768948 RepID=UPI0039A61297
MSSNQTPENQPRKKRAAALVGNLAKRGTQAAKNLAQNEEVRKIAVEAFTTVTQTQTEPPKPTTTEIPPEKTEVELSAIPPQTPTSPAVNPLAETTAKVATNIGNRPITKSVVQAAKTLSQNEEIRSVATEFVGNVKQNNTETGEKQTRREVLRKSAVQATKSFAQTETFKTAKSKAIHSASQKSQKLGVNLAGKFARKMIVPMTILILLILTVIVGWLIYF